MWTSMESTSNKRKGFLKDFVFHTFSQVSFMRLLKKMPASFWEMKRSLKMLEVKLNLIFLWDWQTTISSLLQKNAMLFEW